jgi:hypothetical protein
MSNFFFSFRLTNRRQPLYAVFFAAATMFSKAGRASAQRRVFSPQSGLEHFDFYCPPLGGLNPPSLAGSFSAVLVQVEAWTTISTARMVFFRYTCTWFG